MQFDAIHYFFTNEKNFELKNEVGVSSLRKFIKEHIKNSPPLSIPVGSFLAEEFGFGMSEKWRKCWAEEDIMVKLSDKQVHL